MVWVAAFGSPAGGRLSRLVYDEMKARLLRGDFQGGQPVSVEKIREEFDVSKQPVMEAFRLLAADGLMEIVPQVGTVVARYSTQDAVDFFRMFARFEGVIAETAAARVTPAGLLRLRTCAAGMHALEGVEAGVPRAQSYMTGNRDFHGLIHEAANSRIMVATSRRLWDLSDFLIMTVGPQDKMSTVLHGRNEEHDDILSAMEARDQHRARVAMEQHILGVAEMMLTLSAA